MQNNELTQTWKVSLHRQVKKQRSILPFALAPAEHAGMMSLQIDGLVSWMMPILHYCSDCEYAVLQTHSHH